MLSALARTKTEMSLLLTQTLVSLPLISKVPFQLPLFPGWQLEHDLCSRTQLKGRLEFLKGSEGSAGKSAWDRDGQRNRRVLCSSALFQILNLFSEEHSSFAKSERWAETWASCCTVLQQARTMTNVYLRSLTSSFCCLFIFSNETWGVRKGRFNSGGPLVSG